MNNDVSMVLKGDSWFGSVKAAAKLAGMGVESVMQVKQNSALYPKEYIENALTNSPGGVHIVLKGRHPEGHNLIALGYRYSSKKHCSSFSQMVLVQLHQANHTR